MLLESSRAPLTEFPSKWNELLSPEQMCTLSLCKLGAQSSCCLCLLSLRASTSRDSNLRRYQWGIICFLLQATAPQWWEPVVVTISFGGLPASELTHTAQHPGPFQHIHLQLQEHVSASSTLLRPGKLRGRRLCNFFFLLIFSSQENKSEGALEVVTVFLSGSYPFHTIINNRLRSSQSGQSAVPAVVDKVSSTDLQVSRDWQWQWRECFFDVYVELYYSQACFPHNLWAIISNGILSLRLDFYSPVSCSA